MKKKILVALLSLTLIVTMMPLSVFAQGTNHKATVAKNVSEQIETKIADTGISLFGDSKAEPYDEATGKGDYTYDKAQKLIIVHTSDWKVTGENTGMNIVFSGPGGVAEETLNSLRVNTLDFTQNSENPTEYHIVVEDNTVSSCDRADYHGEKIIFEGNGQLYINEGGMMGEGDVVFNGPDIYSDHSGDYDGAGISTTGSLTINKGKVISYDPREGGGLGFLVGKDLVISDDAEVFASGTLVAAASLEGKIDLNSNFCKGNAQVKSYGDYRSVTAKMTVGEFEIMGMKVNATVLAGTNATVAKAIYNNKFIVKIRSSIGFLLETQEVANGDCAVEPKVPPIKGYQFDGWSTYDKEGKEHSFTFDTPITEDITIYANMAKLHTVSYMDGDTLYTTQEVADGHYTEPPTAPVKEGYKFNGWFISPDAAGSGFDFENTPITEDTVLYADWIKESKPNPNPPINHDKTGKTTKGGITTGDNNMVILFAGLGAVAIGTALVIGLRRREHK